ncbi:MAG: hypothetical protein ACJ8CR_08665 [Roseiflexaceae bacterium]
MVYFAQQAIALRLYIAETTATNQGWIGYLLPADVPPPDKGIELTQAFPGASLKGSFLIAATAPPLATPEQAGQLIDKVTEVLAQLPGHRGFLWLTAPADIRRETVRYMGLDASGPSVNAGLVARLAKGNLQLEVKNGMALELDSSQTQLLIKGSGAREIVFTGNNAPQNASDVYLGTMPFTGPQRGCLLFDIQIGRQSLYTDLNWGLQYGFRDTKQVRGTVFQWWPLADGRNPSPTEQIVFSASIDPNDPDNRYHADRTRFTFTGRNALGKEVVLYSYFRTNFGLPVRLVPIGPSAGGDTRPAGLVIALGQEINPNDTLFQLAPDGDFLLSLDGAEAEAVYALLPGLSGAETLSFRPRLGSYPGDRVRFISRRPTFAPLFPLPQSSPLQAPSDPDAALLWDDYRTAWMTLRPGQEIDNDYSAQPDCAAFYGLTGVVHQAMPALLGHADLGIPLPRDDQFCFPAAPYAGVVPGDGITGFTAAQLNLFEEQILAPTRKRVFADAQARGTLSGQISHHGLVAQDLGSVTTPAGMIVEVDGGQWRAVRLAQNDALTPALWFGFAEPAQQLRLALQSEALFLVVANDAHLGAPASVAGTVPGAAAFYNQMRLGNWGITANVGSKNRYADYRNVMLIKGGCTGSIRDMAAKPERWTQAADFAIPSHDPDDPYQPAPSAAELVVLSQWLQDYIAAADAETDPAFARFKRIVDDEGWTGVLVLRGDVSELPAELRGLMGGLDRERFFMHHFGIASTPIDGKTVSMADSSSMFGLISYIDEAYDPAQGQRPVPPAPGAYDFKVLALRVLFENSAVASFESLAQLTLNRLFGLPVSGMGEAQDQYNSLLLTGSYQQQAGDSFYILDSAGDNRFYLTGSVLNKVEIVKAQFTTQEAKGGTIDARFSLWGFLDFKPLQREIQGPSGKETLTLDLFSFGNEAGADLPRVGLRFSGLGITMNVDAQGYRLFSFETGRMAFDPQHSTARRLSLYRNFALGLDSFLSGGPESSPVDQGYATVTSEFSLGEIRKQSWYGLKFRLTMGTPGELAGKVDLVSYLAPAWSVVSEEGAEGGDDGAQESETVMLGLELPGPGGGADIINLQGVIKLSVGEASLNFVEERESFLLKLADIALRFLGFVKIPPSSVTDFYLFGNPNAQGDPGSLGWYAVYRKPLEPQIGMLPERAGEA